MEKLNSLTNLLLSFVETDFHWCGLFYRLRKVKMDQRKLMDNANTITDMAKVSNKHEPIK